MVWQIQLKDFLQYSSNEMPCFMEVFLNFGPQDTQQIVFQISI